MTNPLPIGVDRPIPAHEIPDADLVDALFQTYLGRPADAVGLDWIAAQAMDVAGVEAMLCNSPEFRRAVPLKFDRNRSDYDPTFLYIQPARLVFCPIAKVGNTSVKDWALRLDGDGRGDPGESHVWLDDGHNRMQGRHWSFAWRDAVARSADWAAVALLRDPVARLVSAYCDKFGRHRAFPSTLVHSTPVYAFFNDGNPPDAAMVDRGLSFRQFCFYLNVTAREEHDTHWAAQWVYLQNHKWDRLFALERIEAFEAFVHARLPADLKHIQLSRVNSNSVRKSTRTSDLSDALPIEWVAAETPPYEAFVTDDLRSFIGNYYALDFHLHEKALADSTG